MSNLNGKSIILGVSGSIAAYKAAFLASRLVQAGAHVRVTMTREATQFVGPLTFASLTHHPVALDVLGLDADSEIEHVRLAREADLMVIAPATANLLAKLAHGLADDAVSATALDAFSRMPLLVAPAMETRMWEHPATRANVALLRSRGVNVIEPPEGRLASGASGKGRMAEPEELVTAIQVLMARNGDLAGNTIVVTTGGTQEAIDPVRVITNRSSGRMGTAIAEAARDRGARVILIAGVVEGNLPGGIEVRRVMSAAEMREQVLDVAVSAEALVMAAAVADYTPAQVADQKIKKEARQSLRIELVRNPDILVEVGERRSSGRPRVVVGFAAESSDLVEHAQRKLEGKKLDLVVANRVPETFGSEFIEATLVDAQGAQQQSRMRKEKLAGIILDRVLSLLERRGASG